MRGTRIFKDKESGFTLMEMLVAIAIGMAVGMTVALVATGGLKTLRHTKDMERLHANAGYINEVVSYWVKEAQAINVSGSTMTLVIPSDPEDLSRPTNIEFKLDENKIMMDDTHNNESMHASTQGITASNLAFYKKTASVRISYTLSKTGTGESLNISTTIARRNFPH